jgi:hypothetical protein
MTYNKSVEPINYPAANLLAQFKRSTTSYFWNKKSDLLNYIFKASSNLP